MTEGQPPPSLSAAIKAALREPGLIGGAGLTVGLFMSISLLPVLGIFFGSFTPAPMIYAYWRHGRVFGLTLSALALAAVVFIYMATSRPMGGLVFLEYTLLALVAGEGLYRKWPPEKMVGYSAGVVMGLALVILTMVSFSQGQGPVEYGRAMLTRQVEASLTVYRQMFNIPSEKAPAVRPSPEGDAAEMGEAEFDLPPADAAADRVVSFLVGIFPGLMIMGTLLIAWANFMMARAVLIRNLIVGGVAPPPQLAALRYWRAPENLVWLVIGCGLVLLTPLGGLKIIAVNGLMVLGLVYFWQGLAVVAFWMDRKKAPPFLRVVIYTLIGLQHYLALACAVLGLFDIWIDFRKPKENG